MVLVFDLDDTLYAENSYVESGFGAVARMAEMEFGWDSRKSVRALRSILKRQGRGRVFDTWLADGGLYSVSRLRQCVRTYRHHRPTITLPPATRALLVGLSRRYPLYIVTDGHKIAQQRKVEALGLDTLVRRVFITHRFGLAHAKPSIYCFEKIARMERCAWRELVYVGDNPAKDFVNLNALGARTIRVMQGSHRGAVAKPGYDATVSIERLSQLKAVLTGFADEVRRHDANR